MPENNELANSIANLDGSAITEVGGSAVTVDVLVIPDFVVELSEPAGK